MEARPPEETPSFAYLMRVQELLDRLKEEEGLSASSPNHYRTILNSIFNEAIRHGRYDANPVRAIHQFRELLACP